MLVRVASIPSAPARILRLQLSWPRVLEWLLIGGASLYVLAFVGAALLRLPFPYPLEITEGASLAQVRAILRGQSLYVAPTLEHVPMIYGPVYYYAAALVSLVTGATFGALRAVSLSASIASVVVLGLLAKREKGSRLAGLVTAGVFAASYPLSNGTLDLARVDALMLALLLGAAYAVRMAGPRAAAVGGALMALSILTKQAAGPVGLILLVYLALTDRRRMVWYGLTLALTLALVIVVLQLQSGRWATLFLVDLPRQHDLSALRLDLFWRQAVLPHFTLALALGLLFFLARLQAHDRDPILFYGLLTVGMLGISWASDSNQGASENVLLPGFAALSLLFGLGLSEGLLLLSRVREQLTAIWTFGLCVGLLQLVLMIYNPRLLVPYRSDGWADDRLAGTLAALPGKVFAPDFDAFTRSRADGTEQPFSGSFAELVGGYGGRGVPEGFTLLQSLRERLANREYDYVVLDPDSQWFFYGGPLQEAGFVDAGPLFPPGDEYWLWRTAISPRAELYVPRERLAR